jgi:predicted nucleic acid-binding protein
MRYLLDVNTLLALAHTGHALHGKAARWYASVRASARGLHTCSITELGFVRIAATAIFREFCALRSDLVRVIGATTASPPTHNAA